MVPGHQGFGAPPISRSCSIPMFIYTKLPIIHKIPLIGKFSGRLSSYDLIIYLANIFFVQNALMLGLLRWIGHTTLGSPGQDRKPRDSVIGPKISDAWTMRAMFWSCEKAHCAWHKAVWGGKPGLWTGHTSQCWSQVEVQSRAQKHKYTLTYFD